MLLAFALSGRAQQSSVHYEAWMGERDVWTSANAALANNNSVMIGYFDPAFNVMANGGDLDLLSGAWHVYGSTTIQTQFGTPGLFSDTDNGNATFDGQKIWLWIFKTTDNSAPTADFSNVTEYGLYSATTNAWNFPAANATPPGNRTDLYSYQVNQVAWGSFNANHLLLSPVAPVPEPAAGALMVIGLGWFGWVAHRRNRTKR